MCYRTGVKRVIDGEMNELGKGGEGRITVRYNVLPVPYDTSYVVLDTDYDTYSVLWACSGIGPIHTRKKIFQRLHNNLIYIYYNF